MRCEVARFRYHDGEWTIEPRDQILDLAVKATLRAGYFFHPDQKKVKTLLRLVDDGISGLLLVRSSDHFDVAGCFVVHFRDGFCRVPDDGLVAFMFPLFLVAGAGIDVKHGDGKSACTGQKAAQMRG